jgi:cytochrome c oxidase subunit II
MNRFLAKVTAMKLSAKLMGLTTALLGVVPAALAAPVPWQLNMTRGVTETAHAAYQLHMIVLWICVVIGVIVFGAMFYAMFAFRKSKGAKADTSLVHSTKVEIIWTTIPVLILIGLAVPATRILIFMADTHNEELTIKITGYQWKWRYQVVNYNGQPQAVNFMSTLSFDSNKTRIRGSGLDPWKVPNYLLSVDRPLIVPTGTKIRFLFTADDVIHAWWVPDLGWKQDAIPGYINEAWTKIDEPGTYRGQCAELCGKDHGFMPIVVEAVPPAEFQQWLIAEQAPKAATPQAIAAAPAAPSPDPTKI